jgi:hypothetical protein
VEHSPPLFIVSNTHLLWVNIKISH